MKITENRRRDSDPRRIVMGQNRALRKIEIRGCIGLTLAQGFEPARAVRFCDDAHDRVGRATTGMMGEPGEKQAVRPRLHQPERAAARRLGITPGIEGIEPGRRDDEGLGQNVEQIRHRLRQGDRKGWRRPRQLSRLQPDSCARPPVNPAYTPCRGGPCA